MTTDGVLVTLIPVATLVLGWFLNEVSQRLRVRAQRRTAIGQALAEILEVHHYMRTVALAVREINRHFPNSAPDELRGAAWLEQLLPRDAGAPERYSRALAELAAQAPLLAFRLRGSDQIPAILSRLRDSQPLEHGAADAIRDADKFLRAEALAPLEEAIRDLAWQYGLFTWWAVRRRLARTGDEEFRQTIERFAKAISAPAPSGQGT